MNEPRKVGPSDLAAGLLEDVEQAKKQRITPDELASLLEQYRGGDDDAGMRLQHGLRHIPYRFYIDVWPTVPLAAEDVLGTLFEEFGECIKRLRKNSVTPEGVEGYIRGDLMHSVTHYMGECSRRINAKASTNSERKKRGLEPYNGLARKPAGERPEARDGTGDEAVMIDHLNDPTPHEVITPTGERYRASKYDDEPRYADYLWEVAKSPLEEQIVNYGSSGGSARGRASLPLEGTTRLKGV